MCDVVLLPVDFFWPWISGVFCDPWDCLFTVEIHPVSVLRVDDPFVGVVGWVFFLKFI